MQAVPPEEAHTRNEFGCNKVHSYGAEQQSAVDEEIPSHGISEIVLKKRAAASRSFFLGALLIAALRHEAFTAQHGLASLFHRTWFERDLALSTALGADSIVHLALRHALGFGCSAAFLATLGGTEVLGAVKLLFALREDKSGAAIAAGDLLIGHKKEVKENKYYRFLPGFSKPILPYERTLFAKRVRRNYRNAILFSRSLCCREDTEKH